MAAKRAYTTAKSKRVFGQPQATGRMFRVGLYARVSTHDQKTLPMQLRTMREYAAKRGWEIAVQIKEVGSGAVERELREKLMDAARRREIDVVLVWRLDRWGRSVADLVVTLKELDGTRRRLRVADRSSGSDHANGPRDGWTAGGLRRVRTRDSARANSGRPRPGPANGKRLGRPATAARTRRRSGNFIALASANRRSPAACRSDAPQSAESWERSYEKTQARPDAGGPHPQRSYRGCESGRAGNELVLLSGKQDRFPFQARCLTAKAVSPLRKGETVEVVRMARKMSASTTCLCRSVGRGGKWPFRSRNWLAIDPDESTEEAIGDWHYWISQGCVL